MAYGVSSNTFLLSLGVSPVIASASVHAAEMFTTLVSGLSHLKFGNVDKSLVIKVVDPRNNRWCHRRIYSDASGWRCDQAVYFSLSVDHGYCDHC